MLKDTDQPKAEPENACLSGVSTSTQPDSAEYRTPPQINAVAFCLCYGCNVFCLVGFVCVWLCLFVAFHLFILVLIWVAEETS